MKNPYSPLIPSALPKPASFHEGVKLDGTSNTFFHGFGALGLKKRGHGGRSWIQIDRTGESKVVTLDKATLMRRCGLPARDLRLLDPLFVYPSTILGREKAIVVSLEQIRCIIMADDVFLMNSLDSCVLQYESELCHRLQTMKDQSDNLPFEFKALELALEVASASLDAQVTELEIEIYPVLDELASSISTVNLEHVRRLKSHLLGLTHRVQKVRDGIEQLMDDDGDMAEMYLTEKKERMEAYLYRDRYLNGVPTGNWISTSAPVSPTCSSSGQPEKASNSTIMSFSRHESSMGSSDRGRHVEELEMLLEAYFVVIDNTSSKLLSLKEYVDDTEDFINIKLDNVRNQLIQFELLLTAATFVVTIFAVVTGVFGMNFEDSVFERASNFNWVLIISSISCAAIYLSFLLYVKYKRLLPL
ncbi:magnesium transporter MRS2-5-like [Phoenix dactylifera]|uniref:Magnesium transporter n=1 Tax=Phoenix dactylifera TaxID=42345 RepID=A0A8B9ADR4_PHODC|nr:magnesium transporter MRS2-5-like [Phoenix dactylifera]XP_017700987.1 magnesium transporter MRS2-5-like [Phoenix dactylifera]XP_038982088.1 magnesium transporter MRS2-5-like [Phoenix dactylifera]XP_038982089.1 magnesium transporter MRS2-5-like [Phoenix dactylifera]